MNSENYDPWFLTNHTSVKPHQMPDDLRKALGNMNQRSYELAKMLYDQQRKLMLPQEQIK